MRICFVSPTYFAPESFIGGGERYAEELSRAMSERADVKLVSFGPNAARESISPSFERVILRSWTSNKMTPFSPALFRELRGADVVHCFQYFTLPTFLASWYGHRQGSKVFVTDLGGGGWTPGYQIDQSRWITAHLPLSEYAARNLPGRPRPHRVIYGGVDLERFTMRPKLEHDGSVVFLGRILPHKGVHFLVEGLPDETTLHVIGPPSDPEYLASLRRLAEGKDVRFHHGLTDDQIVGYLQRAMALVHPTPVDKNGHVGAHELLGLAVLEAMACGCVPIVSRVASLPELVEHAVSGLHVDPNCPARLGSAVQALQHAPNSWRELSMGAHTRLTSRFFWSACATTALDSYCATRGAAYVR